MGDSALALALAVLAVVAVATGPHIQHQSAAICFALLQTLPLAFRRRRPVWVLAIVVAAASGAAVAGDFTGDQPVALLVALYSVAAHCERAEAMRAGIAAAPILAWPLLRDSGGRVSGAVFRLGFLAAGWMLGAYLGELRARAARSRREQELETGRAVAEEQARIGRELHDVIAHTLSVIVVQAAAAEDVFDRNPDGARRALRSIGSTSTQALAELRRVLVTVGPAASPHAELAPQPGLSRLGDLAGQVRAAGLAVVIRIDGARVDLPAGLDLSAYRIAQEALTNTLRHARASMAEVIVRYHPGELILEVLDDGLPAEAGGHPARPGRGLIGMRERVATHGGTLNAGPRPGGGFRIRARFPLEEAGPP